MKSQHCLFLSILLTAGLAGCGDSAKIAKSAPDPLVGLEGQKMMAAAQETLGRMSFILDKYDVEAGYIRTRPQRAGQFFEPWRQDNASAAAFTRANLDSLRRTVEVFVEPQNGRMLLRCIVTVEKLSLPPLPIRSMSHLGGMHTDSTRSLQSLTLGIEQTRKMEWIHLGPDHPLEHRIVSRIQKQLKKGQPACAS